MGVGWNESSVGVALSLMGGTALVVQTFAGDLVDKTTVDRRIFLGVASIVTAISALMILFVQEGNNDHALIFGTKVLEGIASSFIGPCLAALTLASFGPNDFDRIMTNNILWGHIGSVASAVFAGALAYGLYPNIKYCFLVIGFSAIVAILFLKFLPEGDPLMGRGFHGKTVTQEDGSIIASHDNTDHPQAASYLEVFLDRKIFVLCLTGFFFQ